MSLEPRVLDLVYWPSKLLNEPCVRVTEDQFNTPELDQLIIDMIATMDANNGVGLAAPQVGENIQMFIIRLEPQNTMVFINPQVAVENFDPFKWEEGCLSVPGYFEDRERPCHVRVFYTDTNGEDQSTEFVNLYAFAIQHEYDHLMGRTFVDGLSRLKKSRVKGKIKKARKSA